MDGGTTTVGVPLQHYMQGSERRLQWVVLAFATVVVPGAVPFIYLFLIFFNKKSVPTPVYFVIICIPLTTFSTTVMGTQRRGYKFVPKSGCCN